MNAEFETEFFGQLLDKPEFSGFVGVCRNAGGFIGDDEMVVLKENIHET